MSLSFRRPRLTLGLLVAALALLVAASPAAARGGGSDGRYGATTLALDPGAAAALTDLGVSVAPVAPASAGDAGISFPITNPFRGALRTLKIKHSGGLALTAGDTTVELTDFNIDPLRRQLTADVGGSRVPILDLDFSDARVRFRYLSLRIGPVSGTLTDTAAGALNGAFGLPAGTVPAGLKLGDATVNYRLFGGWRHR
jgi:hypothetical protein